MFCTQCSHTVKEKISQYLFSFVQTSENICQWNEIILVFFIKIYFKKVLRINHQIFQSWTSYEVNGKIFSSLCLNPKLGSSLGFREKSILSFDLTTLVFGCYELYVLENAQYFIESGHGSLWDDPNRLVHITPIIVTSLYWLLYWLLIWNIMSE